MFQKKNILKALLNLFCNLKRGDKCQKHSLKFSLIQQGNITKNE